MKNAQKPDHVSLSTLLGWMRDGQYVIPDFQREFEWQPWDIRDLIRSIFQDYYIGSLLLWKGKKENFAALSCEPIYGYTGTGHPQYIVLDGQQRLTAMYYAFVGPNVPLPNRKGRALYSVRIDRLMENQIDQAFNYDWWSPGNWVDLLLANPEELYARHMFPCTTVGAPGFTLWKWLQGYEDFWKARAAEADARGDHAEHASARQYAEYAAEFGLDVQELTQQYQISFIELDEDLAIDKVCDIFTQVNSRGVRLDVFDLMNAMLKPKDLQLKQMWRNAAPRLEFIDTDKMNVYVLQVMSILRQAYCSPKYLYFLLPGQEKPIRLPDGTLSKEVLVPDVADFRAHWDHAVQALEGSIGMLRQPQEFGAVASRFLPYVSILPVFTALQAHVASGPSALKFSGQHKVRLWYWASVFTNRYSGSVESMSARDFLAVRAWIEDDAAEPAPVQEFKATLKSLDLRKEVRSGYSTYNGVFNLLVMRGARDWITDTIPPPDALDDHHIVPASWGKTHLEGNVVHSILNRTPLTTDTNREVIGSRLPNAYLPEMIAKNGEAAVQATLASHFISQEALDILLRNPFTTADFEQFIAVRRETILDAIESLLVKERLDLPPKLRELDVAVEGVELGLRQLINELLAGDHTLLPSHVAQRIAQRIQGAEQKNPVFDPSRYTTLAGRLEYGDLRELQDIMVSKQTWPRFAPRFANKDSLTVKFDQLAELRNGLRHSRSIDDITRKEGEAAILWFNHLL